MRCVLGSGEAGLKGPDCDREGSFVSDLMRLKQMISTLYNLLFLGEGKHRQHRHYSERTWSSRLCTVSNRCLKADLCDSLFLLTLKFRSSSRFRNNKKKKG